MDLLKLNIFRAGAVKQARFLLSTPQDSQQVVYWSDARTLSRESLPVRTGWLKPPQDVKKSWLNLHPLEFKLKKNGELVQDETVLIITDRSYIPADPFGLIKPKDKDKKTSLKDIARMRHAQVRADIGKRQDSIMNTINLAIYGGLVLGTLMLIVTLIRGCV